LVFPRPGADYVAPGKNGTLQSNKYTYVSKSRGTAIERGES
jgi:hypothetical protein